MTAYLISFALGIASLAWLPSGLWHIPSLILVLAVTSGLLLLAHQLLKRSKINKGQWIIPILSIISSFSFGLTWSLGYEHYRLQWQLPKAQIKKNLPIQGCITNLPTVKSHYTRFQFTTSHINHQPISTVLRLSWYQHPPLLQPGDCWQWIVRLKPDHGLHNPGGFNYQRWLTMHGITATGYIVSYKPYHKLTSSASSGSANHWLQWRYHIQQQIIATIHQPALAAILSALTVGSRTHLIPEQKQVFQRTGTSHLIAISGLHISLVSMAVYFFLYFLARQWVRLTLYVPAPRIAAVGALLAAWAYALLAGFSLPTQRAAVMITVLLCAELLYRSTPVWRRMLLALVIVLMLQPMALLSASFWLSFMAVIWIAYVLSGRLARGHKLKQWVYVQTGIFIGLMPFMFYFFHQVSLVMLIANAIAIPWVEWFIVPLCLLASISLPFSTILAHGLFKLAAYALWPLWQGLQWLAHYPHAIWQHGIFQSGLLIIAIITAAILLLPRGAPGRCLALACLLPLIFPPTSRPKLGGLVLTVLDVGQGLAMVLQTAHHTLLYDTGPRSYSGFDSGKSVILPYLQAHNIQKIDIMMISHGDNDHIGGAASILAAMPVEKLLTSVPARFPKHAVSHCHQGQQWRWDGVKFSVLYPPEYQAYQGNNSSCVLRIQAADRAILLTGDIEAPAEQWLVKNKTKQLSASVLVVPHHGSKTSSTTNFIQAVSPKIAIFSSGYYNRFKLPNKFILKKYQLRGIKTLNTAYVGAISIRISPAGEVILSTAENR